MGCNTHNGHEHKHGDNCGHTAVTHDGHTDYLHDNHLHHVHDTHVDEHTLSVGGANAASCTSGHSCGSHDASHSHSESCGHEGIPHGDHVDYIVNGHLHNAHSGHCDDHGKVSAK